MNFAKMMGDQRRFLDRLVEQRLLPAGDREMATKEFCVAMAAEAIEVMNEVNWKHHKRSLNVVDVDALLEELIDVQKFWVNVAVTWGFTPEQLMAVWDRKTAVVEDLLTTDTLVFVDNPPVGRKTYADLQAEVDQLKERLALQDQELMDANTHTMQLQTELDNLR